jgi:hypothetical protein
LVQRLRGLRELDWVDVESDEGSFRLGGMSGWHLIIWEQKDWPAEEFIDRVSLLPGFACALVGDADDVFWQSTEAVNTFKVFGRSTEGLPMGWDEDFGCEKIDVSQNPGRQVAVGGLWLWAASKMWFGPASFALIDRERLLQLPVGRVTARPGDVFVVELFALGDEESQIRRAQRDFWTAMAYSGLEARSDELSHSMADPTVEIEVGTFANGGVRRVVEWFDNGRSVPRSKASSQRIRVSMPPGSWLTSR